MLYSQRKMPNYNGEHPDGEAKCRKFPRPRFGEDPWFDDPEEAKAVCNGIYDGQVCPRRMECLHMAMVNYEGYGVWGGMDEDERRLLRVMYPGEPYRWTHENLELVRRDDS